MIRKLLLLLVIAGWMTACDTKLAGQPTIEVWKSPTCQCCSKWVEHLRSAGFNVDLHNESNMSAVKTRLGVPETLASCHTATIGGYVIEGHVPPEDIKRLLGEKPTARGLAVPGMPVGSPGMEAGDQHEQYQTLRFSEAGQTEVYAQH